MKVPVYWDGGWAAGVSDYALRCCSGDQFERKQKPHRPGDLSFTGWPLDSLEGVIDPHTKQVH